MKPCYIKVTSNFIVALFLYCDNVTGNITSVLHPFIQVLYTWSNVRILNIRSNIPYLLFNREYLNIRFSSAIYNINLAYTLAGLVQSIRPFNHSSQFSYCCIDFCYRKYISQYKFKTEGSGSYNSEYVHYTPPTLTHIPIVIQFVE
jgi:hypothetical protein